MWKQIHRPLSQAVLFTGSVNLLTAGYLDDLSFLGGVAIGYIVILHQVLDPVDPRHYGKLLGASLLFNLHWLIIYLALDSTLWLAKFATQTDVKSEVVAIVDELLQVIAPLVVLAPLLLIGSFVTAFWYHRKATAITTDPLDEVFIDKS